MVDEEIQNESRLEGDSSVPFWRRRVDWPLFLVVFLCCVFLLLGLAVGWGVSAVIEGEKKNGGITMSKLREYLSSPIEERLSVQPHEVEGSPFRLSEPSPSTTMSAEEFLALYPSPSALLSSGMEGSTFLVTGAVIENQIYSSFWGKGVKLEPGLVCYGEWKDVPQKGERITVKGVAFCASSAPILIRCEKIP